MTSAYEDTGIRSAACSMLSASLHVGHRLDPMVGMLTYQQGVEVFRVTDRLSDSDRALLMGETIQRVYNWVPSKA